MGQVKIYGYASNLTHRRQGISDAVHEALVEAFAYPAEKRFQRFFPLADEDFVHPVDRGLDYLIIEVLLFSGRTVEAKKVYYQKVLDKLAGLGIAAHSVEIVLLESPRENWSIRGTPGDELALGYRVEV